MLAAHASRLPTLIERLARDGVSTPFYLYDLDAMVNAARALHAAFDDASGTRHLVAYAMKANSAGPVLRALVGDASCGLDVVSGGELALGLAAGARAERIVFNGVAKTDAEIAAAVAAGICALQVESIEEIPRIDAIAKSAGLGARVSLRVNPEVAFDTLDTHANIATGHDEAKFGIPVADVARALTVARACENVKLVGLACHIGSQLRTTEAYVEAATKLFALAADARQHGFPLELVGTGGGFGIPYRGASEPCSAPGDFIRAVSAARKSARLDDLVHVCEPGRALVAPYGVLVARVVQRKESGDGTRRWLMIDAGMNDLMRPALYQAFHRVEPIASATTKSVQAARIPFRVVGPVCESSDDFGTHELPSDVGTASSHVALCDAGAYGFTMASEYNGRALPSEVFLRGGEIAHVLRPRNVAAWVASRLG